MIVYMSLAPTDERMARSFRALGDPTRLAVFRLVACCPAAVEDATGGCGPGEGTTVGAICCAVPVSQATVSHHLRELAEAGLVTLRREGRFTRCTVAPEGVAVLWEFLAGIAPGAGVAGRGCCVSETDSPAE
jgi:ArsR family transcriptional regulator, arsenate/arsenite/antimonite-responsive transcriptional repressor